MQTIEIEKHRGNFVPCWEIFSSTSKTESGATNEVEIQDRVFLLLFLMNEHVRRYSQDLLQRTTILFHFNGLSAIKISRHLTALLVDLHARLQFDLGHQTNFLEFLVEEASLDLPRTLR